jgi:hypothetical protein
MRVARRKSELRLGFSIGAWREGRQRARGQLTCTLPTHAAKAGNLCPSVRYFPLEILGLGV